MTRITLPKGDASEAARVYGLHKEMGQAMASLSGAIYGSEHISMREREAIRMTVANINQCQICLGFRFPELAELGITEQFYADVKDFKNSLLFNEREKLAIEYTHRFLNDHLNIDDHFFDQLKAHFDESEIFAMTGIIGGLMINGRLLQVFEIDKSCSIDALSKDLNA